MMMVMMMLMMMMMMMMMMMINDFFFENHFSRRLRNIDLIIMESGSTTEAARNKIKSSNKFTITRVRVNFVETG
jgi:hypothetical protein